MTAPKREIPRNSTVHPPQDTPLDPSSLIAGNDSGTIPDAPAPSTLRAHDAAANNALAPAIHATLQALNAAVAQGDIDAARRATEALRALFGAPSEPAAASSPRRPRKRSA